MIRHECGTHIKKEQLATPNGFCHLTGSIQTELRLGNQSVVARGVAGAYRFCHQPMRTTNFP